MKNAASNSCRRKNRPSTRVAAAILPVVLAFLCAALAVTALNSGGLASSELSARSSDRSTAWQGYREPLSDGVKNVLRNALYMYDTFWTPLSDVYAWGTSEKTYHVFTPGRTYRGIPYGQPVHEGRYVGTKTTVSDFLAALSDPDNSIYTSRGLNTWYYTDHGGPIWYSPYYSNDCSGFVSAALGISRHTTAAIGADTDLFPVIGTDLSLVRPGDLLNSSDSGHVIMVYDVVYESKGGKIKDVVTIEQTPDIIVIRTFGRDGICGTLSDLQNKIDRNKYKIVRYKYIEDAVLIDGADKGLPRTVNGVSGPSSLMRADGAAEGTCYVDLAADNFVLTGYVLASEPLSGFRYRVNGGEAVSLDALYYSELTAPAFGFDHLSGLSSVNAYKGTVPLKNIAEGDKLEVFAVYESGREELSASLKIAGAPEYIRRNSYIESPAMLTDSDGVNYLNAPYSPFRSNSLVLNGWCVARGLIGFEVRIDDGLWYPVYPVFRDDVYTANMGSYSDCRDCNGFYVTVDMKALGTGSAHTVTLRAVLEDGGNFTVATVTYGAGPLNWIAIIIAGACALLLIAVLVTATVIAKKRKKKKAAASAEKTGASMEKEDIKTPDPTATA